MRRFPIDHPRLSSAAFSPALVARPAFFVWTVVAPMGGEYLNRFKSHTLHRGADRRSIFGLDDLLLGIGGCCPIPLRAHGVSQFHALPIDLPATVLPDLEDARG